MHRQQIKTIHERMLLEAVARLTATVAAENPDWTNIVITRQDGGVDFNIHSFPKSAEN